MTPRAAIACDHRGMVEIYGKDTCPYTAAAVEAYRPKGGVYINVKKDPAALEPAPILRGVSVVVREDPQLDVMHVGPMVVVRMRVVVVVVVRRHEIVRVGMVGRASADRTHHCTSTCLIASCSPESHSRSECPHVQIP